MSDLLRDSPVGQMIRYLSKNKYLRYPEEIEGFELPPEYVQAWDSDAPSKSKKISSESSSEVPTPHGDLEKVDTRERDLASARNHTPEKPISNQQETKDTVTQAAHSGMEGDSAIQRTKSMPVAPVKTSDGIVLVDWYTTDDPANPQNWSQKKKTWVAVVICTYTFVVYAGSSIYTSSQLGVEERFGVKPVVASLGLALYVLAYGMGPLLWSPISEIPVIGRSPVYITTMAIFVLISIGPPLVKTFAGLLVLRFLQAFFGSPCLATGGATLQDMYSLLYLPYALTAWVASAYFGPALGPLLSGYAVMANGWTWSLWEILWAAGPVFLIMFCFLPETSTPTILLHRARRLRKVTGNQAFMSQSEMDQKHLTTRAVLVDAIIKPLEITVKDPAIAFVNLYTSIIYGIYYSFFEVFPLVYPVYYGFNLGEVGVVFICILVACGLGAVGYCLYLYIYLIPDIMKRGLREQEHRLVPALFNSFGAPIGLFLFAWTARASIHWIVPTIGIVIYGGSGFVVFQCIFVYVPLSYPRYAASLFASNDFFRSSFACAAVLFGRPLFINLGVDKGTTTLAGLSVIGIIGMFVLYMYGARLRARSSFAVS